MKPSKRYNLFAALGLLFLVLSELTRAVLYVWSIGQLEFSTLNLGRIFLTGLFFDVGTISFFLVPYGLYLLLLPNRFNGTRLDKIITYFTFFLGVLIFIFTTFSEFTFWEEFSSRFNFIAVDYLIYTNEVVANINESYPLPILLSAIFLVVFLIFVLLRKKNIFSTTFHTAASFKEKTMVLSATTFIALFFYLFITNNNAEWLDDLNYIEFLRDENRTDDRGQTMYDLWDAHGRSAPETIGEAMALVALRDAPPPPMPVRWR